MVFARVAQMKLSRNTTAAFLYCIYESFVSGLLAIVVYSPAVKQLEQTTLKQKSSIAI